MEKCMVSKVGTTLLFLFISLSFTHSQVVTYADPTHYIIRFDNNATQAQIGSLMTDLSAVELEILPITQVRLWEVPASVVASYGGPIGVQNQGVGKTYVISMDPDYAGNNYLRYDPYSGPFPDNPNCPGWINGCTYGDYPVNVSIHDTGYDGAPITGNHPQFQNYIRQNQPEVNPGVNTIDDDGNGKIDDTYGWNFVDNIPNNQDFHAHGTHVAGIVCNMLQSGGAGSVHLLPLQTMDAAGSGSLWNLVQSVEYALSQEVQIMSMSLSYIGIAGTKPSVLEWMFNFAESYLPGGTLFVVAAGNDGVNLETVAWPFRYYPAQFDSKNMIVVGAMDCNEKLASFSNYGAHYVDIAAPGVDIVSTVTNNNLGILSGTSMAAPFVTAAAARYASETPSFLWQDIKDNVLNNSQTVSNLTTSIDQGKSLRFCPGNNANKSIQEEVVTTPFENTEEWSVFPNPADDYIQVNIDQVNSKGSIMITNLLGQVMATTDITPGQQNFTFQCSQWPKGMYQIRLQMADIRKSLCFIH